MAEEKKAWQDPVLELLDIKLTMNGPHGSYPDKKGGHKKKMHDDS